MPAALHIKAEVMRWVYMAGTERVARPPPPPLQLGKPGKRGSFFSSLLSPHQPPAPPPTAPAPARVDPLTIHDTNVALSVFSAGVDTRLDIHMATELHRSMKKKPPAQLTYELIYVRARALVGVLC